MGRTRRIALTNRLFTIGYEGIPQTALIRTLLAAGVQQVLDVRAVAASRRAGFSKTLLKSSLEHEGIAYHHLRALGTPKAGREAARKGRVAEMEAIFSGHLREPEAQIAIMQAISLAKLQSSALLCFESCAEGCHRRLVSDLICRETGFAVHHLRPFAGGSDILAPKLP